MNKILHTDRLILIAGTVNSTSAAAKKKYEVLSNLLDATVHLSVSLYLVFCCYISVFSPVGLFNSILDFFGTSFFFNRTIN